MAAWATVTGCTGSATEVTPLAVVVAGQGPGGGTVGLFASPLPPTDPPSAGNEPTWRGEFTTTLTGTNGEAVTVRDMVMVRGSVQEAWVLARGASDYLFVASMADLRLDDPTSWSWSTTPTDLTARVAASGALAPETLCAVRAVASRDGRWLGLVHDPSVCGGGSSSVPAVLLLDLDADETDPAGVRPAVPATNDGRTRPVFADLFGTPSLLWSTVDGGVLALATEGRAGSPTTVASSDDTTVTAPLATGFGARGFVVLDDDTLSVVPLDGTEPSAPFDPDLPGAPRDVVDPSSFDVRSIVVRTTAGISLIRDLEGGGATSSNGSAAGAVDVVVDPYGYAFVVTASTVRAFDLLSAGTVLRSTWLDAPSPTDLTSIVAVDWVYETSIVP